MWLSTLTNAQDEHAHTARSARVFTRHTSVSLSQPPRCMCPRRRVSSARAHLPSPPAHALTPHAAPCAHLRARLEPTIVEGVAGAFAFDERNDGEAAADDEAAADEEAEDGEAAAGVSCAQSAISQSSTRTWRGT